MRIQQLGFDWGNPEEFSIEKVNIIDESSPVIEFIFIDGWSCMSAGTDATGQGPAKGYGITALLK